MITVTLIRQSKKGNAVNGIISFKIGERPFNYPTIENADFIIPAGTYPPQPNVVAEVQETATHH